MTNNNNNERENEMFSKFDTEIQSDELVDERISDEDLESAADFYDELDFEIDAMEHELDYHNLDEETRLADEEWDEHWQQFDMELLDVNGSFQDIETEV